MLEATRHNYKLIAITTSTIGAGLPLWTSSVRQIDFTEPGFLLIWIAIGLVVSFVTQFVVNLKTREMIGCFAIGYVLAVVIHFVSTVLLTNYIQSDFEISLSIALATGIFCGWMGSLLWKGVKKGNKRII